MSYFTSRRRAEASPHQPRRSHSDVIRDDYAQQVAVLERKHAHEVHLLKERIAELESLAETQPETPTESKRQENHARKR